MRPYLLSAMLLWSTLLHAQLGFPVKEFGENGKVFTGIPRGNSEEGRAVLPLANGKTIIALQISDNIYLVRHHQNGTLDLTFGNNGFSEELPYKLARLLTAVLQPDGTILIYGASATRYIYENNFFVAKYLPNGQLDLTFGIAGVFRTDFGYFQIMGPFNPPDVTRAMVALSDNKILFCGVAFINGIEKFFLYRLLPNGIPDPGFGIDGVVTYDNERFHLGRYELAVQANGDIFIGGFTNRFMNAFLMLGKFFPDGGLDSSFAGGPDRAWMPGWAFETPYYGNSVLSTIAIQPDGKIISLAYALTPREQQLIIYRHLPNGLPDTTFGNSGSTNINYINPDASYNHNQLLTLSVQDVTIQPDGKILVGGALETYGATLWRFTSSGQLDKSFYGTGMLNFNKSGSISDLAIGSDGNISVTGVASDDYLFARLLPNGSADYSLANASFIIGQKTDNKTVYQNLAVQPDGKILAAGISSTSSFRNEFFLSRFNPDGSPDLSFGSPVSELFFGGDSVQTLKIYPDGRILVAAASYNLYHYFYFTRFLPNGQLDETFGGIRSFTTNSGDPIKTRYAQLIILPDEHILVIGSENSDDGGRIFIKRLLPNGSLDELFETKYIVSGKQTNIIGAVVLNNGKILIGGQANQEKGNGIQESDFFITRLNPDGSFDKSFGTGAIQYIDFGRNDFPSIIKRTHLGQVFIAGEVETNDPVNHDFGLTLLNADGTLNTSFGNNGKMLADLDKPFSNGGSINYDINTVDRQTDGKILITGTFQNGSLRQHGVGRLNLDGTLDLSFGTGGFYVESQPNISPFNESVVGGNRLYVVGTTKDRSKAVLAAYQIDDQTMLQVSRNKIKAVPEIIGNVQVLNNPAQDAFTLVLSLKKNAPAQVRIMDASGKVVDSWQGLAPNAVRTFGASYRPGMYLAEVIQGSEKKVIKLVKQ
jgi:uncharacterized delta-60 repeat protein